MKLDNETPLAAGTTVLLDKEGYETLLITVKGTYLFGSREKLELAQEQVPVQWTDEYYGEPSQSSIKYEGDIALFKNGTDVVLNGHAYAPGGNVRRIDAILRVGPLNKNVRVFGDRVWEKTLGIHHISDPAPFEKLPLLWERSFGGADQTNSNPKNHGCESRNPVGTGYRAKRTQQVEGIRLPNLEDPRQLIGDWTDRPEPAGFGFIGRDWEPRRGYAGTYNEAWTKTRSPLLALDFNERYYQGAHPSMVSQSFLNGDEVIEGEHLSSKGPFRYKLPGVHPKVAVSIGVRLENVAAQFDTLIIEPDFFRVILIWRGRLRVHRRLYSVKSVEVRFDN